MEKKYYFQFLAPWLTLSLILLIVFFITIIIQLPFFASWEYFGFLVAFVSLLAALVTVAKAICPVTVRPTGITTYNFRGGYSTVSWEEIHDVRCASFLFLRYYIFKGGKDLNLYLPMFMTNFLDMRYQVAQWAGQQHPLSRALYMTWPKQRTRPA
ncbi:MAG TPA: hypothetical protein PLX97_04355 [Gemmatales bacterium]|nr:hypothetical protein [Gemmatales bacterium]